MEEEVPLEEALGALIADEMAKGSIASSLAELEGKSQPIDPVSCDSLAAVYRNSDSATWSDELEAVISEMGGEQHASLVENAKGHPKFKDFLLVFLAQPGIESSLDSSECQFGECQETQAEDLFEFMKWLVANGEEHDASASSAPTTSEEKGGNEGIEKTELKGKVEEIPLANLVSVFNDHMMYINEAIDPEDDTTESPEFKAWLPKYQAYLQKVEAYLRSVSEVYPTLFQDFRNYMLNEIGVDPDIWAFGDPVESNWTVIFVIGETSSPHRHQWHLP